MKYLRKTLWGVGLIIVIELLKKIFDRIFPEAIPFHHNFLSCVQLVVLLWIIISIVSEFLTSRKHSGKNAVKISGKTSRRNFLILLLLLALPEILFTYWLHHPSRIPSFLNPAFQDYYMGLQRNVIPWNGESSAYDSSLFYILRPSSRFIFENYEFSDSFHTNKMGLRDDDSSLVNPEIISVGDSYGMGWGVEQDETFAEILGRGTGKKVLNAGVTSYGTARELVNLYRLDTSNLQYLIIQYSRNDAEENTGFVQGNYTLSISPEATYNSGLNIHRWSKVWFPGKHFMSIIKMYASKKAGELVSGKRNKDAEALALRQTAVNFVDILLHSAINFKKTKVFVVDISNKEALDDEFVEEVKTLKKSSPYKEHFNDNLIIVPVADTIGKRDYYILDDHLRPSGHQKIAARLKNYMFPQQ